MTQLLLTSFAPWRAHQRSNTSDDLIQLLISREQIPSGTVLMRHLPVHFQLAPCKVIAEVAKIRPAVVVCCGMAEQRRLLTLERYGKGDDNSLETGLDLSQICAETCWTAVSHDAGVYVCNHLYYRLLAHIQAQSWSTQCLFVHVPLLTRHNSDLIVHDFSLILSRLLATSEMLMYETA